MSWLHYLIEANIYLGVFYLCYCLFLNRDTHYTLGRVYLIFSCVVAFVLPLTQLSILRSAELGPRLVQVELAPPAPKNFLDMILIYLYIAGAAIAFFILLFRLRKLYTLMRNDHSLYNNQYKLINLDEENTAFSFFNYLFIGNNVPQAETVIAHEMVHIRQKHSVDIIFLEILKVINWFNPFIYLTQRSLKTVHEYIADEQTAVYERDALAYSTFLLNNAYGIQGISIAHSFFNYNLLKKRIIMLNKNRSGKLARLKYLAALPLCAGMLCTSTLVFSKDYGVIDLAPRVLADTIKKKMPPPPPEPPKPNAKSKIPPPPPPEPPKHRVGKIKRTPPVVKMDEAPTVDQVKLPPPPPEPPKHRVGKVKSPPPVVVIDEPAIKVKPYKLTLAEPAVVSDKPVKKRKVDQVKFPPRVVVLDEPAKKVKPLELKVAQPVVVSDEPAKTSPPIEKP